MITAVLVQTPSTRTAYDEPLSTIEQLGPDNRVQIDLDWAVVGVNTLPVYLTGPGGKAFDVTEVTTRLSRPNGESLTSIVERRSLGHYETNDLAFSYRTNRSCAWRGPRGRPARDPRAARARRAAAPGPTEQPTKAPARADKYHTQVREQEMGTTDRTTRRWLALAVIAAAQFMAETTGATP